jgi:hypothetical protein
MVFNHQSWRVNCPARPEGKSAHLALDASRNVAPAVGCDLLFQDLLKHGIMEHFQVLRGEESQSALFFAVQLGPHE